MLLQGGAGAIKNGSRYIITKWDNWYYKVGQAIQSGTGITKQENDYEVVQ